MKEDLIKILNFKLKQIKENIGDLNRINGKIEDENNELEFIQKTIENFKGEEHGFDIYKFSNIDRETFNKLLMNLSDEVLTKFGTNSCNYDGLIYLINGINSGISLALTQEQTEAINLFIDKLLEKEKEYQDVIVSLNEDKQKLDVKDLDVLNELDNKYSLIVENIDDKKYVTEIDEVVDAINYSELSNERAFDILCYLLKYNSEVYELSKDKNISIEEANSVDLTKPFELEETTEVDENIGGTKIIEIEKDKEDRIKELLSFNDVNKIKVVEIEQEKEDKIKELLSFTDINEREKEVDHISLKENTIENTLTENEEDNSSLEENDEYNPILPSLDKEGYFENENIDLEVPSFDEISNQSIDVVLPEIDLDLPFDDEIDEYDVVNIPFEENDEVNDIEFDDEDEEVELEVKEEFNNFESNVSDKVEIEINETTIEEDISNNEINDVSVNEEISTNISENEFTSFFAEYEINVDDEINKSLLLKGSIDNYKNIINKLKELEVYDVLKDNNNLLIQILLYSDISVINEIIDIIESDLSVDSKDKNITTNIVFKTMPSIFIKGENGNYDNFVKNVKFLKENGIDLINLFDFSREVFVANNDFIINNYEIVRNYDLTVNAYNAKYLLLLPNISSKIDYYVESIYKDNSEIGKNEMFDGIEMIKLYPNKLNTVNSETIKRLRYSSENGLKVFGNKEKALAGEITNLNVDMINMSENFLNSLFNNEFDIIDRSEVDEYINLINSNEFVEMKEEGLLEKLAGYKVGLRYFIGNINVSSNKVIRNYNILVNNDVDKVKALLFAICYNLVITKTEYERLKLFVNGLGGN